MDPSKDIPALRLDKTYLAIRSISDESESTEYWRAVSTKERLQHIERLRRLNYGVRATGRLQILRIVGSPRDSVDE
jgi:hypothetical protein